MHSVLSICFSREYSKVVARMPRFVVFTDDYFGRYDNYDVSKV